MSEAATIDREEYWDGLDWRRLTLNEVQLAVSEMPISAVAELAKGPKPEDPDTGSCRACSVLECDDVAELPGAIAIGFWHREVTDGAAYARCCAIYAAARYIVCREQSQPALSQEQRERLERMADRIERAANRRGVTAATEEAHADAELLRSLATEGGAS